MIRIEIKSTYARVVDYTDKITLKPRSIKLQDVFVYLPSENGDVDGYDKIEVVVDDKIGPIAVGNYTLTAACIYLDRNRRLAVSLRHVKPILSTLKQAA